MNGAVGFIFGLFCGVFIGAVFGVYGLMVYVAKKGSSNLQKALDETFKDQQEVEK